MLKTEQEAMECWCPMVRAVVLGQCKRIPENSYCVASKCMMWRWGKRGAEVGGVWDQEYPVEGYCGLAGIVEE